MSLLTGALQMGTNVVDPTVKKTGLATVVEASDFLSLSKNKVYQGIQSGEIPVKRFGKSVRIPWAWLHEQAACES